MLKKGKYLINRTTFIQLIRLGIDQGVIKLPDPWFGGREINLEFCYLPEDGENDIICTISPEMADIKEAL